MFTAISHHALRLAAIAVLGLVCLFAEASPAAAQYFGRNKVQYRTFDFRIMQTENFDVYFYPEEEEAARDGARMAERWYARLSRVLDHKFDERQPFIFYGSHPEFQQTTTYGGFISEGTGGFTEIFKQRVVMPFTYSYEETDHVVGHELVHAFQYDISGTGRAGGELEAAARRYQVPGWFTEGMAEYLSVGPIDANTAMWVRDAALRGDLPSIERMTYDPRVFPYRWGQALWAYVGGRWGDAAIGQILKLAGQGIPYPQAFERILNISLDELSEDWHASIRRAYLPLLAERPEAREVARPLITGTREGGSLNLAPVLSPDGKWVAFLSELDFIDVELHLANAQTGEVVRTLQKGTALDAHFGSLRYINSAGTFSPDGQRFAFSALRGGSDVLVIVDVNDAERLREIRVPGVGEIMNPTWSTDGASVVFTGIAAGITDLYAIDVASGESRKLTDDKFTELHPAYSPDGRSIAFTTDRGPETDLDRLVYGPYRIAVVDVATNAIRLVEGMAGEKNINPVWTRDGGSLFFVSNRSGIPNVYRVNVASGEVTQITNLYTGVSGITDMSPAITSAQQADRLLFSVYEGTSSFNIYALGEPAELAGTPVQPLVAMDDTAAVFPALLPPIPRPKEGAFNRVTEMLANETIGLPSAQAALAFEILPYRPNLGLDYLGQPQVGVSTGSVFGGGGVYGGIGGIFSDVLGRHTVAGFVQAQGELAEIGFAVQYINSRERWNYGFAAQRIPLVYGFYNIENRGVDPELGPILAEQVIRLRFFDTNLTGIAQYPFSAVQRVEFSGGVRRISQDRRIYELLYAQGRPFLEQERDTLGVGFNLAEASAALVYDNSLVGYTSPFAGQRYRFELTPTVGELTYLQAVADYRRYFFLRPFTVAVRGLHFGRYGRDSDPVRGDDENPILGINNELYLGQTSLVRGYYGTWRDCQNSENPAAVDCAVLNQLFGSRIGVASAELRFPLIRQLVVGTGIGFPPIEGIAFVDGGLAWSRHTSPVFERFDPTSVDPAGQVIPDNDRRIVTSAGVGARVNLFGYIVLEVDYVRAFERNNGWKWQFGFQPGF